MLEDTDRSFVWKKDLVRHRETWWWKNDVSNSVNEKIYCEISGNRKTKVGKSILKQKKKKARRAVYQAKYKVERKTSGGVMHLKAVSKGCK